eukprot:356934-Rhodomonas_salina.2
MTRFAPDSGVRAWALHRLVLGDGTKKQRVHGKLGWKLHVRTELTYSHAHAKSQLPSPSPPPPSLLIPHLALSTQLQGSSQDRPGVVKRALQLS